MNNFYLSLTNNCNLSCTYCSADAGPSGDKWLPLETAVLNTQKWLRTTNERTCQLVLSGGEPTLWGYEKLHHLCRVAREEAAAKSIDLTIGIQTNGTTICQKFIDWCHDYEIEPSISLDGLEDTSNKNRGKADKTIQGLKQLRDAGLTFGVIVCMTKDVLENLDSILEWFESERFLKVRVNYLGTPPGGREKDEISSAQLLEAWVVIFSQMNKAQDGCIQEKNVQDKVRKFLSFHDDGHEEDDFCAALKCGAGKNIAALNPDGQFSLCIEKSMTDGLPSSATFEGLKDTRDAYWEDFSGWEDCQSCHARMICDHGCPAYHQKDKSKFEVECRGTRHFANFLQLNFRRPVHDRATEQTTSNAPIPLKGRENELY